MRELTCQFLNASGYSVLQAKDGIEALEIIAGHDGPIRLVLSDLIMPRMGGTELAWHLQLCCANITVAFMTGYSEYSGCEEKASPRSDRSLILHKPFSKRTLLEKIGEIPVTSPGSKPTKVEDSRVQQLAHDSPFTRYPAGRKTLD